MKKRGPKPKSKVKIEWSPAFAYALGLLATDGSLSKDGRHFDFTSKDREQIENFMKCFGIKVKVGYKTSGHTSKKVFRIQFGDVNFYKFLLKIGFMPAKTKIISELKIPDRHFFDFLRGHLDGDGTFYSYWDPRWRASFMFYTSFLSASYSHLEWVREKLRKSLKVKGHFTHQHGRSAYQLKYAKKESLKILHRIYYAQDVVCLGRKRLKIERALSTIGMKL